MEANLLGIDRLVEDVGDQLIRGARVVFVMVVAQREIAELHGRPRPVRGCSRCFLQGIYSEPDVPARRAPSRTSISVGDECGKFCVRKLSRCGNAGAMQESTL